jgi:two-component system, cell cycle sensor histidine kinase and response regulator CckA
VEPARRFNILCVDDEVGIRELVRRCLADDRLSLTIAGSGDEALALTPDPDSLDLLITDEVMPGMEGHELARRLRHANPDLKVLYLTGYADHLFDAKSHMWNAEAFLDKPFTADGLRQAVALLVVGRLSL